jgi:hypothetical protein
VEKSSEKLTSAGSPYRYFVEGGHQQSVVVEIKTESEGAFDSVDHYVEVIISAERNSAAPRRPGAPSR